MLDELYAVIITITDQPQVSAPTVYVQNMAPFKPKYYYCRDASHNYICKVDKNGTKKLQR